MDNETKNEIKLSTVELKAYAAESALYDRIYRRLIALYSQTHETILGRRIRLFKRRRISKANKIIDQALSEPINIDEDAINQVRFLDQNQPDN